jgi:hypothetical protein
MPRPAAYLSKYQSMTVTVPGNLLTPAGESGAVSVASKDVEGVKVKCYSNTGSTTPKYKHGVKALDDGTCEHVQKLLAAHDALPTGKKLLPWFPVPVGFSDLDIRNAYQGKGSPVDIATTLMIWVSLGFKDAHLVIRKWSSVDKIKEAIDEHCSKATEYIGLDCLGFVVNYVNDTLTKNWTKNDRASKDMPDFRRGMFRSALSEVMSEDVIVYANIRHIAVVDFVLTKSGSAAEVNIAESLGDNWTGPNYAGVNLIDKGEVHASLGRKIFRLQRTGSLDFAYVEIAVGHSAGS